MRHFLRCLLPLITVLSINLPAAAAPQILLAVASENTVPMRCDTRYCEVEIGTICLQPYRSDPARGTPYTLLDPKSLEVVAEGPRGQQVQIPLARGLRIVAARGHTAVRVTIPRANLARGGLGRPALRLTGNVIFTPQPVEGDTEPQSDADTTLARTTLRTIAAKAFRQHADRSHATGVILRAINLLPRDRPPTRAEQAMAEAHLLKARLPRVARGLVQEAVDHCQGLGTTFIEQEPLFSYRGCLAVNHDTLLEEVFMDYRALLKNAPWG